MHNRIGRGRARRGRPFGIALALVVSLLGCGEAGESGSSPTTPPPAASPTSGGPATVVERGAPRWETVTTLTGTGAAESPPFTILPDSIQWRARFRCDTGRLRASTDPPPRRAGPLIDEACPGTGERFAIVEGDVRLRIEADGPWEVIVDQQIDTPLREPAPEGMATAPVLRQGSFYPIEKDAKGTARIFKGPDGKNVLRLQDFEVSTNVDLFVWLSEASAPKTSAEAAAAPYVVLGNLKSTLGDQNYVLPADLSVDKVKSIVIWCAPVRQAYGGAALAP